MQETASHITITSARDHCPKCQCLIPMTGSETQFYITDSNTPRMSVRAEGTFHVIQFTAQETENNQVAWVVKHDAVSGRPSNST